MTSTRTTGFNHVATLTPDLDRYLAFYGDVFGAQVVHEMAAEHDHPRMAIVDMGNGASLNVFEVAAESIVGDRARIGGRGPIDHYALMCDGPESLVAIRDRLLELDATPGVITDFGTELSVFFRDPDGAELEICCVKPEDYEGEAHPPGADF